MVEAYLNVVRRSCHVTTPYKLQSYYYYSCTKPSTDLSGTPVDDAIPAEEVATRSNSCLLSCLQAQRTLPAGTCS